MPPAQSITARVWTQMKNMYFAHEFQTQGRVEMDLLTRQSGVLQMVILIAAILKLVVAKPHQ